MKPRELPKVTTATEVGEPNRQGSQESHTEEALIPIPKQTQEPCTCLLHRYQGGHTEPRLREDLPEEDFIEHAHH